MLITATCNYMQGCPKALPYIKTLKTRGKHFYTFYKK